jgi:hypothetical protein
MQHPGRHIREIDLKKLSLLGIVTGAALLTAAPISVQPSPDSVVQLSLNKAEAQYGSYRRQHRRAYRRAPYSAYYDYGYGYGFPFPISPYYSYGSIRLPLARAIARRPVATSFAHPSPKRLIRVPPGANVAQTSHPPRTHRDVEQPAPFAFMSVGDRWITSERGGL